MKRWLSAGALVVAVGFVTLPLETVRAQAGVTGEWTTLSNLMPINPVHIALLNTGKVLIVSGSGNVATETFYRAAVWDPQTDTVATQPLTWDMFCNGMAVLPDGRVLVNGGNLQYDPFRGEPRNAAFDPVTETFTDLENMAHGRWYPTVTVLGDGRVMTFSGLSETGSTNTAVEIYTVGSGWSPEYPAGWTPPLYPRMHLLPNGNVFYSGSGRGSRIFNTATRTWSAVVATTNYANTRSYGTSVLLPLTPANGYKPRVMIFGGGNPGTATTEIIDLSAPTPAWQYGPPMSQPRIELNATILPSGKVLVVGGSRNDEDAATASLNADLFDPATNSFSSAGANAFPRLYHSNALLLPDATVLVNGGNPQRGNYEHHQEIYSPAYLFNGDGSRAIRPVISGVGSGAIRYGGTFQVTTPNAAEIASIALVRPGAPTHAFDQEQRFIGLSFTAASGVLTVTAPPNGNIAPPGYYMLFILNSAGVPSVATFVHLSSSTNQPPTATIDTPAGNVTINPGGSVLFQGSGSDPDGTVDGYSWTFPGGIPASSLCRGRQRRLRGARELRCVAHRDRQRRASERAGDAHRDGGGFRVVRDSLVAIDRAGRLCQLHSNRSRRRRLYRNCRLRRDRFACRSDRHLRSTRRHWIRLDDAERHDQRRHARRQLSVDDYGNEWIADANVHGDAGGERPRQLHPFRDAFQQNDRQGRRHELYGDHRRRSGNGVSISPSRAFPGSRRHGSGPTRCPAPATRRCRSAATRTLPPAPTT